MWLKFDYFKETTWWEKVIKMSYVLEYNVLEQYNNSDLVVIYVWLKINWRE